MNSPAVDYIRAGLALVPIPRGRKGPTAEGWQTRERCILDEDGAAHLNGGNLGLAHAYCTPSPTCALDIDDFDQAESWLSDNGIDVHALLMADDAVQIRSGRPGRAKLLYRLPRPLPTLQPTDSGLELRCASKDGATLQDVLPPSIHPDTGKPYEWRGDWTQIPEIPEALLALWESRITSTPKAAPRVDGSIPELTRNNTLTSMAGSMRRRGMSQASIEAALLAENAQRCNPPLPDAEVRKIAASVSRYAPATATQTAQEPPAWLDDGPPAEGAQDAPRVAEGATWPEPLDLVRLAGIDPQPPRFIIDPMMPSGYATLFAAHGGTGKSTIALYQAVCVALGLDFAGYQCDPRRVLYLSCEDRERVLHWRLSRICRHLGVSMADLAGRLEIVDLVGHESILWIVDSRSGASYTAAYGELARRIKASGSHVVYVDGIADVYGGEENSRAHVKQFVNALVGLIDPDDGAIVLIGHVNKVSAAGSATSEGYSGSTGWHNAVRARWYLHPEQEQDEDGRASRTGRLLFDLQKNNLGQADETTAWRWGEDAGMFLPEEARQSNFDRVTQQRDERRGILLAMKACADAGIYVPAATTGRRTAFHVLAAQSEFADSMRSGKPAIRRFWREIEHLRSMRLIDDDSIRRADYKRTAVLVLTTEGIRSCG